MRRMTHLLTLLILVLLTSCRHAETPHPALAEARTYISVDPSRALDSLMTIDVATLSEGDAALLALLRTQAADKCLIPHRTDSVILQAVRYYAAPHRDASLRALSLFYLGSVCRDLGDDFRAVEAYLPALDLFATQRDTVMQRRTAQNIADHLFNQHLLDEAADYYRLAYSLASATGDTLRMIMPTEGVAKCDMARGNYEASADGYQTVLTLSRAVGNATGIALACEQLSLITRHDGNDDAALAYATEAETLRPKAERLFPYYLKGMAYRNLGLTDSAAHYLTKALGADDVYLRASATVGLSTADSLAGRYEAAYSHMRQYADLKDTIATGIDRLRMGQILYNGEMRMENEDLTVHSISPFTTNNFPFLTLHSPLLIILGLCALLLATMLLSRRRRKLREHGHALFEQQLDACMNQFLQTPWNEELHTIHLSQHRGFDAFADEKVARLRHDLLNIFHPVATELRLHCPALTDGELCFLFLYRLGYSTYTQSICTACSENTIRSYKHRIRAKLPESYINMLKL